jgi:hypothetical protein
MQKQLTKSQEKKLSSHLKVLKEDDAHEMSLLDMILDLFIPAKIGIRKNGLNVEELMSVLGLSIEDHRMLCGFRTSLCQLQAKLIKEGFAFSGIKDKGKLKRYGWSTEKEFEQVEFDRKERCAKEISNTLHYLDDDDRLALIGKSFLKEIDKQLLLFDSDRTN